MDEFRFSVKEDMEEERIDKGISLLLDTVSRTYLQKLIKEQKVFVNGKPVKANYRLKTEDEIVFSLPPSQEPDIQPEPIPLTVLYEDSDLLIVDKPKGMVVHPAAGHYSGTLVNAILYHCREDLSGINGVMRPGIVHRIDKDTTGSLIVCKNDRSHQSIAAQLKEHTITRKYRAIVYGHITDIEGTISAPIGRHPTDRKKMAVNTRNGKTAVTHYRVLEHLNGFTYLECELETGRTHQIRVHMAYLGHPLLGDELYSSRKLPGFLSDKSLQGQTLHAMTIGLYHPEDGRYLEWNAPLPDYFTQILSRLSSHLK